MDGEIQNTSTDKSPDSSSDNAKAFLEYSWSVYRETRDARDHLREHAHKVIAKLFAAIIGLGAGVTFLVQAPTALWCVALTVGIIAFVAIGVALWFSVQLFLFKGVPIPPCRHLDEEMKKKNFDGWSHAMVTRALTENVVQVVQQYNEQEPKSKWHAKWVNILMLISVISTLLFLGLSATTQVVANAANAASHERSFMMQEGQDQQGDSGSTSQGDSQPQSDTPSIVQPPDTSTKDGGGGSETRTK